MTTTGPATTPLRKSLFLRFAWLTTGALILFALGYLQFGLRPVAERVANSQFVIAAAEVDAALRRDLDPAQTLLVLARSWALSAQFDESDPAQFNRLAKPLLAQSEQFTSVVAGSSDGRGWMLLELPNGAWMNRFTNIPERGDQQLFVDWAADGSQRTRLERADYDPRQRPWYRGALQSAGRVHWTDPYVLFTTRDPGITASIQMETADGSAQVLGIDIKLLDVSRAAALVPVSANGFALVLTSDGRLLALPPGPLARTDEDVRALALQPASALGNPVVDAGIGLWERAGRPTADVLSYRTAGQSWLASFREFRRGEQVFWVSVFAPETDFVPDWQPLAHALLLIFALTLLVSFLYALRYTRRFSEPLESLAAASSRIAKLDFRAAEPVHSGIAEIQELTVAQDQMRQMLHNYRDTVEAQSADLQQQIDALRAAEGKLAYLSQHDPLTGLPNRLLLNDRLANAVQRAERRDGRVAVLFLDLDRFKSVNDSQGHPMGDRLLCIVAKRLSSELRAGDTLARLGGDEFVILAEDLVSADDAQALAEKLLDALSSSLTVDGRSFRLTGSIGISLYPDDGADPVELIRNADSAMYQAKAQGRNTHCFYTRDMTLQLISRLQLEEALHGAIAREEFVLHYQPQLNMRDGRVIGVEALVRWMHPQRGLVAPADFIGLAEESGLIGRIGAWVLEESCRQWRDWEQQGIRVPRIAINLSVKQLHREALAALIRRVLSATGVPAEVLELEMTESIFLESPDAFGILLEIGNSGVSFALDDFGTGYSSLGYLKKLPLARLKIDREFTADIGNDRDGETVVRAIIKLAATLGREVIAEGVETDQQVQFLLDHGCTHAQGYYYAKPLSAEQFSLWWAERQPSLAGAAQT